MTAILIEHRNVQFMLFLLHVKSSNIQGKFLNSGGGEFPVETGLDETLALPKVYVGGRGGGCKKRSPLPPYLSWVTPSGASGSLRSASAGDAPLF